MNIKEFAVDTLKEREMVRKLAYLMRKKAKSQYGVDLKFGNLSLVFHDGECVRVIAQPRLRLCELQNSYLPSVESKS